ncbi:unnamed protein product [Rotaria magnacalcarata]|uniref:Uncharacterized protein n=2 Tax=Rotaria magnacalcarata TaxID=392030 RepID=A0A816VL46_9BILA|nr:unnamed protein product [Rotaria magnacalcarata]CAF1626424.1 unnamed protein product [Rotaria magnacalcarata]CAF2097577.1 unnamed protein product [Rotaria magnacalcarata]CAF2122125.1 unnamed protein product [Rotaria magnacalcarata]CAF3837605.1 unnamed protein product [Rotaria magnacalcarata]
MVKLLVFAILLASSPATGLLETLFRTENGCYTGCSTNYAASAHHLNACRKGCDFKLYNEDCAKKCKSFSEDSGLKASCEVGCTLSGSVDETIISKPIVTVDPIRKEKDPVTTPADVQPERPRSIILIRLRQHPSNEGLMMPMENMHPFFNGDPIQMFNDIIKQFQSRANNMEQSIRHSFHENSKEFPELPSFDTVQQLPKGIPVVSIPINSDSESDSSSEEHQEKGPMMNERHHDFKHHHDFKYHREHMQPMHNRFRQFITDVRTEWNDLVRKQPKIPIWIFLAIFLSSSAILWYMVMSLCRHRPSRDALSIRAQELIFHPYDYEAYEKEKIQPDDQPYEVTESLPIKVKLSNI